MGFTPGAYCKRKTEKVAMECQLVSVEGRMVQLKELKSGGLLKIGTEDFMAGQWMLFKPKAGPQCLEDLTGMGPHDSEEFKLALMISDIHQEVHGLVKSCNSPEDALQAGNSDQAGQRHYCQSGLSQREADPGAVQHESDHEKDQG